MNQQQRPPGLESGFYTRTLIRVHFVTALVVAAIAGKIADSLGYNGVPWAFAAAGVATVALAVWVVVRRVRARKMER